MKIGDDRLGEAFKQFICADCDPSFKEDDEEKEDKPYVILLPEGESAPELCPRCSGYLSFVDGATGLRITNTPAEQYVARREAEAKAGDQKT
jgi:hypothetical protein